MSTKRKASAQHLIDSLLDDSVPDATARPTDDSSVDIGTAHLRSSAAFLDDHAKTYVIPAPSQAPAIDFTAKRLQSRLLDRGASTEIRARVDESSASQLQRHALAARAALPIIASSEASLRQSESLRMAQTRIADLEREVERLRRENEKLASAGDALRRRTDELAARAEKFETQSREAVQTREEEQKILRAQLQAKEREASESRSKTNELEHRLDVNFKKIRLRERELEHRLEIVKMESATLAGAKDKAILDLKRQVDLLAHDGENGKAKSQELYVQFREKQETMRRVVRALRIALTMLEGEDDQSGNRE